MGTVEGHFVGWLEAEAVAKPEQDTHAQVTALVEEYSTTLYRVAYSVTRNAADAEDVVQETFLRVLRHRNKLAEVRDYRVWLVRIAWNLVLDGGRVECGKDGNHRPASCADSSSHRYFAGKRARSITAFRGEGTFDRRDSPGP
jgi:RNA polymerase sigma factor (sigma-70 family)